MNKIIIAFCEGDHDIAFLCRILSVNGFTPYKKKVKNFITPLNKFYTKSLPDNKIEDYEFRFKRPNPIIPFVCMADDNNLIIFHNLSGDGNILNGQAEKIMTKYLNLNDPAIRKVGKYDELNYRFLFFLDADNTGVDKRLEEMNGLLGTDNLLHHKILETANYELSCYIFHNGEHASKEGNLEDILLDLMTTDNTGIFKNSDKYLSDNKLTENRQKEFISNQDDERYKGRIQFKMKKSIIAVSGQLQFSGSSNSVIIAKSDFITKNDITSNSCCDNIITLFK